MSGNLANMDPKAFENTSTNIAAAQMRNALTDLAQTVNDPEEKKLFETEMDNFFSLFRRYLNDKAKGNQVCVPNKQEILSRAFTDQNSHTATGIALLLLPRARSSTTRTLLTLSPLDSSTSSLFSSSTVVSVPPWVALAPSPSSRSVMACPSWIFPSVRSSTSTEPMAPTCPSC